MIVFAESGIHLSPRAKQWFRTWHETEHHLDGVFDDDEHAEHVNLPLLGAKVFGFLRALGFTGSDKFYVLDDGIFFSQTNVGKAAHYKIDVLISEQSDTYLGVRDR